MSDYIKKKPLRWFYAAMAVLLTAGVFVLLCFGPRDALEGYPSVAIGALTAQLVARLARAAWHGE